jgi:hypothetical protein
MNRAIWLILAFPLFLAIAQQQDDLKKIQSLGQQCVTATIEGDFNRLVDLTYPKLVERLGGKEKMVAMMEKDSKEMKLEFLPTTVNAPTEVLKIGAQKFVILTYQLRLKVPEGILKKNSFLIGVLDKPEDSWTFVDGTNLDPAKAKMIFPGAGDKLQLPAPANLVLEKAP